ncbi:MAG: glutamate racemase [Chloroflexota bacterium]
MSDDRPIGIFDSGVGGLTVLRTVQEALPNESTIFIGDLARCPYGTRPQRQVAGFARQIGEYLALQNIKLLIIACNTATAAAYADLAGHFPFPVIGVIDPGAQAAVAATRNGKIGVIATNGTVASGAYTASIHRYLAEASVYERPASWLVTLIERGSLARPQVERGLEPTLAELDSRGVDTLILGCTHFPLVRDIFRAGVGEGITILDSGSTTAREVSTVIQESGLESDTVATHRLLVTGPPAAFAATAQAMFRASPVIETVEVLAVAG